MIDKSKIILTDVDGVVLNWEYAFGEYMEFQGHQPVIGHNKFYSVRKKFNLPSDASGDLIIKTFNESAAIGFLPPLRDAQYFIKKLHEQHQFQFIAITSLSLLPYAQQLRKRNLGKLFGEECFLDVICLDTGAGKSEVLARLAPKYQGCFWLEDKPENADIGHELGLKSLLMEHGHNMNYEGPAKIVLNWEEIYNIVV